jgi:hypothetical protein
MSSSIAQLCATYATPKRAFSPEDHNRELSLVMSHLKDNDVHGKPCSRIDILYATKIKDVLLDKIIAHFVSKGYVKTRLDKGQTMISLIASSDKLESIPYTNINKERVSTYVEELEENTCFSSKEAATKLLMNIKEVPKHLYALYIQRKIVFYIPTNDRYAIWKKQTLQNFVKEFVEEHKCGFSILDGMALGMAGDQNKNLEEFKRMMDDATKAG